MTQDHPVVFVVDDDISVQEALKNLLRSVGLQVHTFGSAQEFLAHPRGDTPGCLILDVRLPGMSGMNLQAKLAESNSGIPIVFITAHGDVPMSVKAMKAGAVEFLIKPFHDQELLDAVQECIRKDCDARRIRAESAALRARYETLTMREREVMELVVRGLLSKEIAGRLGISLATVKLHRGVVMRKMDADSLADLVRMSESVL